MARSLGRPALALAAVLAFAPAPLRAAVVYDSIPGRLPPNVDSVPFAPGGISEFGDAITLAGTGRSLKEVALLLSSAATRSPAGAAAGFVAPLTLTLYALGSAGPNPQVGTAFASRSISPVIPWRPAASAACTDNNFMAADGHCYTGIAQLVTFDFSGVSAPSSLVFGLSFATGGPMDGLGLGFSRATTVGTDINPDGVELNTTDSTYLTTGRAGVFGPDTDWGAVGHPAARFTVADTAAPVPEPGTPALLATAFLLFGLAAQRARHRP